MQKCAACRSKHRPSSSKDGNEIEGGEASRALVDPCGLGENLHRTAIDVRSFPRPSRIEVRFGRQSDNII